MKSRYAIFFLLIILVISPISAEEKIGVVLMHGKWGTPLPVSPIGKLVEHLKENSILVITPEMPWSRDRDLDKTYEEAMREIDDAVKKIRAQGATKIIVGGHSMGANAAIGYGARRSGLAGILAIAPGHVPEIKAYQKRISNDWKRAKEMVDAGKGDVVAEFNDLNDGDVTPKSFKANIYLSWYSPNGPASMPDNVTNLKPNTPLLWIIGENDRMNERGKSYAYNNAPENPKNAYVVVKGGHKATPRIGKDEILDWLNNLR